MTRTEKLQKQLSEIRSGKSDGVQELKEKRAEINAMEARMKATNNGFIRQCCWQEIERLKEEYRAIEAEF